MGTEGRLGFQQDVQADDEGDESVAQGHPKSCGVDCMVAGANAEADWTLPIVRCKRHYTGITALLLLIQ